ncbi:MAG TPA: hypothetical protein GX509_09130 [Firmicutes bacterium]|nr:hypothetical protein [Bacillota bacterium]HHY98889.1 hypothetical protein [Bacillota bacterium]
MAGPRTITEDELNLIAALRPFMRPRAQQLIDTFLEIANQQLQATGQKEIDTRVLQNEVMGLIKQQMENFILLGAISGILTIPELLPDKREESVNQDNTLVEEPMEDNTTLDNGTQAIM